jgi:hypothetical protein
VGRPRRSAARGEPDPLMVGLLSALLALAAGVLILVIVMRLIRKS